MRKFLCSISCLAPRRLRHEDDGKHPYTLLLVQGLYSAIGQALASVHELYARVFILESINHFYYFRELKEACARARTHTPIHT